MSLGRIPGRRIHTLIANPPQISNLSSWPRAATKGDETAGAAVAHTLVCAALISMPAAIVLPRVSR